MLEKRMNRRFFLKTFGAGVASLAALGSINKSEARTDLQRIMGILSSPRAPTRFGKYLAFQQWKYTDSDAYSRKTTGNIWVMDLDRKTWARVTNSGHANYPHIYGDKLVYADRTSIEAEEQLSAISGEKPNFEKIPSSVYLVDLSDIAWSNSPDSALQGNSGTNRRLRKRISTAQHSCAHPKIYGDTVVWRAREQDHAYHLSGFIGLDCYSISSGKVRSLSEKNRILKGKGKWGPQISRPWVCVPQLHESNKAWLGSGWNVTGYTLLTDQAFEVQGPRGGHQRAVGVYNDVENGRGIFAFIDQEKLKFKAYELSGGKVVESPLKDLVGEIPGVSNVAGMVDLIGRPGVGPIAIFSNGSKIWDIEMLNLRTGERNNLNFAGFGPTGWINEKGVLEVVYQELSTPPEDENTKILIEGFGGVHNGPLVRKLLN